MVGLWKQEVFFFLEHLHRKAGVASHKLSLPSFPPGDTAVSCVMRVRIPASVLSWSHNSRSQARRLPGGFSGCHHLMTLNLRSLQCVQVISLQLETSLLLLQLHLSSHWRYKVWSSLSRLLRSSEPQYRGATWSGDTLDTRVCCDSVDEGIQCTFSLQWFWLHRHYRTFVITNVLIFSSRPLHCICFPQSFSASSHRTVPLSEVSLSVAGSLLCTEALVLPWFDGSRRSHFTVLGRWGSHRFHVHTAPSCKCLSDCLVLGGRTGRMKEEKWCRESCFSCLRGRSRISTMSDTNFSHLNAEGERLGCRQPNSDAFYHQVWKHIW